MAPCFYSVKNNENNIFDRKLGVGIPDISP